jgi:hypothetical protein
MEPLHGAAAGVEDKFFSARFDQRARAEAVEQRRRRASAQQGDAESVSRLFGHDRTSMIMFQCWTLPPQRQICEVLGELIEAHLTAIVWR